ncbi:MAG: FAD-dependent oxidoreductase, partial [Erysipelotrichia bacterium]|nr:FAD-dependent oxidoreductase [Erysipelotrichia bacterium]
MYDAVIIGAGIVGTMLARDLSRYQLKTAVIDRENDIANGATMANSAIVHTGYDPEDNTMKAKMNVAGAKRYPQICRGLHCEYKTVGAYVAGSGSEEEAHQESSHLIFRDGAAEVTIDKEGDFRFGQH